MREHRFKKKRSKVVYLTDDFHETLNVDLRG